MSAFKECGDAAPLILTPALDGFDWSSSRLGCLKREDRASGPHRRGDCLLPRAGFEILGKKNYLAAAEIRTPYCPVLSPLAIPAISLTVLLI
jgi:hypothetical protein